MTHRIEQLQSTLGRVIGQILSEGLADPRVRGLISVTAVKLSADHRVARVGVSVMPAEAGPLSLQGLRHAAGFIQSEVGRRIRTRTLPRLEFHLDMTLKKEAQVMAAIHQAILEDQARQTQRRCQAEQEDRSS